jgi:hypothetical protein
MRPEGRVSADRPAARAASESVHRPLPRQKSELLKRRTVPKVMLLKRRVVPKVMHLKRRAVQEVTLPGISKVPEIDRAGRQGNMFCERTN